MGIICGGRPKHEKNRENPVVEITVELNTTSKCIMLSLQVNVS